MNSVIVLCVGLMGAANPAQETIENPRPVQVADAGCNLARGGCYQQPAYRSPVAQRGPLSYSTANCNCSPGACADGQCSASCPNGQCSPLSYSAYSTGSTSNCANGQCSPNGGKCYGPNCSQQYRGSYYPATTQRNRGSFYPATTQYNPFSSARYNPISTNRYPVGRYTQPYRNPFATDRNYNGNWTNTYRPVQPSNRYNSNTSSPFFN